MQQGFWKNLKKPIMALAPMANVTDAAFRRIIAKYGRPASTGASQGGPDLFYTEFVSVEGLLSKGRDALLLDFLYSESERPIVAQVFGGKPEQFFQVAKLCKELKFDGIDINMGCPDVGVEKSGGGAALIKNPKLAQEIIRATQEGAPDLPISVKTRIGYNKNEIDTWIPALLETKIAALIVHLRTRKEMSAVPAHWEVMLEIKKLRDSISSQTLLLGNGDVQTVSEAREKATQYGLDGIMIGRGIFGNPWLFAEREKPSLSYESNMSYTTYIPTTEERLLVCLEHTKLFEEIFKGKKHFDIMKKHYKAYINGFDGAKELRMKLMEVKDVGEVEKILKAF